MGSASTLLYDWQTFLRRERANCPRETTMKPINLHETSLLVVDVQRGFTTLCPAELPVPGGLEIVPQINRLLVLPWARIDASQDWHPPDHRSFLGRQDNLYPPAL